MPTFTSLGFAPGEVLLLDLLEWCSVVPCVGLGWRAIPFPNLFVLSLDLGCETFGLFL